MAKKILTAADAAEQVKAAKAAATKAGKEAKAAKKAAEKAEKAGKEKEAAKAAAKAEKAAEKAEKALNVVSSKQEAEAKAKEAEKAAEKAFRDSLKSLVKGTKDEGKGLNAIYRNAKAYAAERGTQEERARLLYLAGIEHKEGKQIKAADIEAIKISALISGARRGAKYHIKEDGGRVSIAHIAGVQKGANVYIAAKAEAYGVQEIIERAALRILRGEQPQVLEAGKYYEKGQGGRLFEISKAEAKQREIKARDEAAAIAAAAARAEAQRAADEAAGRTQREKAEAKARRAAERAEKANRGEAKAAAEVEAEISKAGAKIQAIEQEAKAMRAAGEAKAAAEQKEAKKARK